MATLMHRRPSRIDGIRRLWCEESLASEGDIFEASVDHAFVEGLEPLPGVIATNVLSCAPSRDFDGLDERQPQARRPLDPSPAFVGALDQPSKPFQPRIIGHGQLSLPYGRGRGGRGLLVCEPEAPSAGFAN